MTNRERFQSVLNCRKPADRLPVVEWAGWWDKTINRWKGEGLPEGVNVYDWLGLDQHVQYWIEPRRKGTPGPKRHGGRVIRELSMEAYEEFKQYLFPYEETENWKRRFANVAERHARGDIALWMSFEGFFWFPRTLFGIEDHFYAFEDCPDVIRRMNEDLLAFNLHILREVCAIAQPDFMTFAEDMSYNHGPMLSRDLYNEFLLPYYRQIVPELKKNNVKVFIDTDGKLDPMIPWMLDAGVEGVLPLEKQAGVDVVKIRERYPRFLMVGAFDKTCMHLGEGPMRAEFERLLPVMRAGGYIPGCDHQTPPLVSLNDYKIYVRLLKEYAEKAVR